MRNDYKKQHPRKEQNRHQTTNVSYNKNSRQEQHGDTGREPSKQATQEQDIKGMDIDLMNYTDI